MSDFPMELSLSEQFYAIIDRSWSHDEQMALARIGKVLEDVQLLMGRVADMLRR